MEPPSSYNNNNNNNTRSEQREAEQRDEQVLLDAATSQQWHVGGGIRWDNDNKSNNNRNDTSIWSHPAPPSQQRVLDSDAVSTGSSTNHSSFKSAGGSHRAEDELAFSFSNLAIHRPVRMTSSLQAAAAASKRDELAYPQGSSSSLHKRQSNPHSYSIGKSSSASLASGAGSIPGICATFSGSTNGSHVPAALQPNYPTQHKSSLSMAEAVPPPGFHSPIQTRKKTAFIRNQTPHEQDHSNLKSSSQSRSTKGGGRRQRGGRGGKGNDMQKNKATEDDSSSSKALQRLMRPPALPSVTTNHSVTSTASTPLMSGSVATVSGSLATTTEQSFLPLWKDVQEDGNDNDTNDGDSDGHGSIPVPANKKKDWLLRMNRRLNEIPIGELDPSTTPLSAVMNAWSKTKSSQGASMVELWLHRVQQEYDMGNVNVVPTSKMYTMAGSFMIVCAVVLHFHFIFSDTICFSQRVFVLLVDAWAKSGEGGSAATRAEALLQHMYTLYQAGQNERLRPTTGIFNAVINAWARSREEIAPRRAEQILEWMTKLHQSGNLNVQPDKYTFNTVIHAYAKSGGPVGAEKAEELLLKMHALYDAGNEQAKPDTITVGRITRMFYVLHVCIDPFLTILFQYNVVINAWAKSGGKGSAKEAERLLAKMHNFHRNGDHDVKPTVVTYGAVIDALAKSGDKGAAARADTLLANMIQLHQSDPVRNADLRPNTYVFNTVINCWAKSKEHDAASKAEEMLVAMSRLHASGIPNVKPDAFTYTAVIDSWAKSGYRGAATRADQLLDKMEAKYLAGDAELKPNTFTYNAVINALAKSGEPGAAARAERVLQNMVSRHRSGGHDEVKPTTINFNTVLDAWAKSGGGRAAAERSEEILEWMDRLHKNGNKDVRPDTITFNAVLDAWARSGDRMAPHRAEQILEHMNTLFMAGNKGVKPDTYTYNTLVGPHLNRSAIYFCHLTHSHRHLSCTDQCMGKVR